MEQQTGLMAVKKIEKAWGCECSCRFGALGRLRGLIIETEGCASTTDFLKLDQFSYGTGCSFLWCSAALFAQAAQFRKMASCRHDPIRVQHLGRMEWRRFTAALP